MSKLKINENQFLEKQELNRLVKFLDSDGFRKFVEEDSLSFGLINSSKDNSFSNGRVQVGTNSGTIKINELKAIDKNINFIYRDFEDNIAVNNDGVFYWVKIKFTYSPVEVGVVSIDNLGNLVGIGTKFTEVLRGQPNFPVKIRFEGSTLNTGNYEVRDVISDTNAVISGIFANESNIKLVVVGTFGAGTAITSTNTDIYQYDSCELSLVAEPLPTILEDEEFYLARVKNTGGVITLEDKRLNIYKTKANYLMDFLTLSQNPLIGIESIKFDHELSTKDKNIINLSWGFRTSNWTIEPSLNKITISDGAGGKYKTTSDFNAGDFNGWRLYTPDGNYSKILTSIKSGTQINIILDVLDTAKYTNTSQELFICPDSEEIEIILSTDPSDNNTLPEIKEVFNINTSLAKIWALCYKDPSCLYNIKYRYKHLKSYSPKFTIPSSTIGYLNESSFDDLGNIKPLIDRVYYPYVSDNVNGFILLTINPSAYSKFVSKIDLGDNVGVELISDLETLVQPLSFRKLDFKIGGRKQTVIIQGSDTLTGDTKIDFITTGAKEGNRFYLDIDSSINNDETFKLEIYQDNTTLLYEFSQDQLNRGSQYFVVNFDGTDWQVTHIDRDYNADDTFKSGEEVIDISVTGNVENINGNNVLVVSGYYESISIINGVSDNFNIRGIRYKNGKYCNNLKIKNKSAFKILIDKLSNWSGAVPSNIFRFNYLEPSLITTPGDTVCIIQEGTPKGEGIIDQNQVIGYANITSNVLEKVFNSFGYVKKPLVKKYILGGDPNNDDLIPTGNGRFTRFIQTISQYCLLDISAMIIMTQGGYYGAGEITYKSFLNFNGVDLVSEVVTQTNYKTDLVMNPRRVIYCKPGDIIKVDIAGGYFIRSCDVTFVEIPY